MKKFIPALFFLFSALSFSQYVPPQNNYKVTVTQQKTFAESFNEGLQAGAAARQARAASAQANAAAERARLEAMKDNYSIIDIDLLKDNGDKYKYVLVDNVTGHMSEENMKTIILTLRGASIYGFVSMLGKRKKYWTHQKLPEVITKRPESVLKLSFHREAQGQYTRTSKVTLKDYNDEIIYQANHKNKDYATMLYPLLNKYITTEAEKIANNEFIRSEAIKKLKEARELLDLEVISKEDYDKLVEEYRPILLKTKG